MNISELLLLEATNSLTQELKDTLKYMLVKGYTKFIINPLTKLKTYS